MARYYITPPPMNPVSRILASLFGILVLVGAIVFGFFVLLGGIILGVLAWGAFAIRRWWLRRKGVEIPLNTPQDSGSGNSETIEAEYTVISRRRD